MKRIMLLVLLAVLARLSIAQAGTIGPLVDGVWLVENHEALVILDARKDVGRFAEGHIPGAILVDVNRIRVDREVNGKTLINMRPDPTDFQQFMRAHGINNDSLVVITHPGDKPGQVAGAARLYWHLKYYGFDQVALLDGGNQAWTQELEDLVTEVDEISPGNYLIGQERRDMLATMEQVREALSDDTVTLVDTRDIDYHLGLEKKDYVFAYGHIPGSRILPYKMLNPVKQDTRYLARENYVKLIDSVHIDLNDRLIVYCNSAYEASSVWFLLHEILGKKDVSIYDGSLHQWTQYDSNPMIARLSD